MEVSSNDMIEALEKNMPFNQCQSKPKTNVIKAQGAAILDRDGRRKGFISHLRGQVLRSSLSETSRAAKSANGQWF